MAGDTTGFQSDQQGQQGASNPWMAGIGSGGGSLGGIFPSFGSDGGFAGASSGAAATTEQVLGRDTLALANAPGASEAKDSAKNLTELPSREEVLAYPVKYGRPAGVNIPAEDYA